MRRSFTRRAALAALAASAVFPAMAQSAAPIQKFSAIEVDVSPVREKGDTITAQWLAQILPDLLKKEFANRLSPGDRGAPVLVARIDGFYYGPPGSAMQSMISTHDFIEGAGVVKSGARTLATYPLETSADVSAALIDAPNGGQLRVLALAGAFAHWLPGQMGL